MYLGDLRRDDAAAAAAQSRLGRELASLDEETVHRLAEAAIAAAPPTQRELLRGRDPRGPLLRPLVLAELARNREEAAA